MKKLLIAAGVLMVLLSGCTQEQQENLNDKAHDLKNDAKDAYHDMKNDAKDAYHDTKNEVKDAMHNN